MTLARLGFRQRGASGTPAPLTLSEVAGARYPDYTNSTIDFSLIASKQAGDLCIWADASCNVSGIPTTVTPSGFTKVAEISGNTCRMIMAYKVMTSGDLTTVFSRMASTNTRAVDIIFFRPNRAIISVTNYLSMGSTGNIAAANNAPNNLAVNAGTNGLTPSIVLAKFFSDANLSGASPTLPGEDNHIGANTADRLAWLLFSNSPANKTLSMGAVSGGAFNGLQGQLLTVA